jgi:hypothetical protein
MSSRTYRRQKQSRRGSRRHAARKQQNTTGLWLLLALVLLSMVVWALLRVPIDLLHQIEVGALVLLLVVLLLIAAWFVLRSRLTPEERAWRNKQQEELDQADETARAVGAREVELDDLRHLTDREFERLAAALVETMGVASEVEVVGGAGDGGIDVRGKNRFHQLFVAQCKRYFNHSVAPKETREFAGAMSSHESHDGWFITTSTFSPQAEYDVKKWTSAGLMVLVDGALLLSFIHDHWDALPARWRWRLTQCMVKRDRQRRAE